MGRIYLYKLASVNGGAPCVADGLLSLAICKPMIRASARDGDLLVGVAANSVDPGNRLVYVARVTDRLVDGRYYKDRRYAGRADCIYQWAGNGYAVRKGGLYHGSQEDLVHDLGLDSAYPRANVLLSTEFRYFGTTGPADYRQEFPHFANAVARLGRGHRVNHGDAVVREIEVMAERLLAAPEQTLPTSATGTVGCAGECGTAPAKRATPRSKC